MSYDTKRDEHLAEMADWAEGRRSWTNTFHPDHVTVAALDAAEVAKHASAAMAYGFLAALEGPSIAEQLAERRRNRTRTRLLP